MSANEDQEVSPPGDTPGAPATGKVTRAGHVSGPGRVPKLGALLELGTWGPPSPLVSTRLSERQVCKNPGSPQIPLNPER